MKRVAIFGSTGTIGQNALSLVRSFPRAFRCTVLVAGKNIDLLCQQIAEFSPEFVSVQNSQDAALLAQRYPSLEIRHGESGAIEAARRDMDVAIMGIVGFAALKPTLELATRPIILGLANKESVVVGGALLRRILDVSKCVCIPVDSEHNALFQLLGGLRSNADVSTLVLTASGGPFFSLKDLDLSQVTPEEAVRHPNWKMGAKISVDSATMMNKALELAEASALFGVPEDKVEIWVHPQSIVHGAVWLTDNTCLAQLSRPDMKSSIAYAMGYPERLRQPIPKLSFSDLARLEFLEPDDLRFPAISLVRRVLQSSQTLMVVVNAANEILVERFLSRAIRFTDIVRGVEAALENTLRTGGVPNDDLDGILDVDARTREFASVWSP